MAERAALVRKELERLSNLILNVPCAQYPPERTSLTSADQVFALMIGWDIMCCKRGLLPRPDLAFPSTAHKEMIYHLFQSQRAELEGNTERVLHHLDSVLHYLDKEEPASEAEQSNGNSE